MNMSINMSKKIIVSFVLVTMFAVGAFAFSAPQVEAQTLWSVAQEQAGAGASNASVISAVKALAQKYSIAIPEWGISGTRDAKTLTKAFFQSIFGAGTAQAQATITWDGGGSTDNWSEATNWSTDTVPTSSDDVIFDGTSTKNAVIDVAAIGGVNITSNYSGTISIPVNQTISVSGTFTEDGGTFVVPTGSTLSFIDAFATANINSTGFDARQGTLNFKAEPYNQPFVFNSNIPLNVQNVKIDSGPFGGTTRYGGLSVSGTGSLNVTGNLTGISGSLSGTINLTGNADFQSDFSGGTGTVNIDNNASTVLVDGKSATLIASQNINVGSITVSAGATAVFGGDMSIVTLTSNGVINNKATLKTNAPGNVRNLCVVNNNTSGVNTTLNEVTININCAPTTPPAPTCPAGTETDTNLISWWKGENNPCDSEDGNHGTEQNGVTYVAGQDGQAFSFDGVNDYLKVPGSTNLVINGPITLEAWVKPSTCAGDLNTGNIVSNGNYYLAVGDCHVNFFLAGGGWLSSAQTIPLNQWSHIKATWDGSVKKVYINDQEAGSQALTRGFFLSFEVDIGARTDLNPNAPFGFFSGLMDDVKIYSSVTPPAPILPATLVITNNVTNQVVPEDSTTYTAVLGADGGWTVAVLDDDFNWDIEITGSFLKWFDITDQVAVTGAQTIDHHQLTVKYGRGTTAGASDLEGLSTATVFGVFLYRPGVVNDPYAVIDGINSLNGNSVVIDELKFGPNDVSFDGLTLFS